MEPDDAVQSFRTHLLAWYAVHGRTFPWRGDRNPFHVLIAERMLHRTQARQVVEVYHAFLARFPSLQDLAAAEPAAVLAVLAPLGLAWRFDSFIPMARYLVEHHGGQVPATLDQLLAVPGVGPYTAAAVLAFAFHQPVAVVDTNTVRVAGRYLHGVEWVGDARKRRAVRAAVATLLDPARPVAANYALLDLGARICLARSPLCSVCPVAERCRHRQLALAAHVQPQSICSLEEMHDERIKRRLPG
jgi:A/G-specific adenine glycosylase